MTTERRGESDPHYRHGWCGVTRNIINGKVESLLKPDSEISSMAGWGVCSGTCDDSYQEVNIILALYIHHTSLLLLTSKIIPGPFSDWEGQSEASGDHGPALV